jgi:hypothetical protein
MFQYNDGGRQDAGFKGIAKDCAVRAIAIATQLPYDKVYRELNHNYSKGTPKHMSKAYLARLGWKWTPTMGIGTGCKVHVKAEELPNGRLVLQLTHHLAAMIDGVLHDTHDCSRNGTRCVYGYWSR